MRSSISVSLHMWFCCRQEWSPNSSETLIVFNGVVLMKAGRLRVPQRRYVRAMDVEVARKGRSVEGRIIAARRLNEFRRSKRFPARTLMNGRRRLP
jgi:hypothetical protein